MRYIVFGGLFLRDIYPADERLNAVMFARNKHGEVRDWWTGKTIYRWE